MTNMKLAYIEHISQLLIKKIKNVNHLVANSWYELELVRQDVREITKAYEEWLAEMNETFDELDS
ncbi:MAG: hypothetical protein H0X26_05265 [Alphaproteobacteria bacterium]|nr:hypothetical protein [Alphaproteobacteria bacterium]